MEKKTKKDDMRNILGILIALAFFVFLLNPIGMVQKFIGAQKTCETQTQTASVLMPQEISGDIEKITNEYETIIKNLEAEIDELKAQGPEIKEIIKEVPVEKIVYKEVIKELACDPTIPNILSIDILPGVNPTSIKWKTDKLTKSKIFISGGDIVGKKEFQSVFSVAQEHRVNISDLQPHILYYYEIQATTVERGKELSSATKKGGFYVTPEFSEE